MYIIKVKDVNYIELEQFLQKIDSIKSIDKDILNNGIALLDDEDQICGYITYEVFCEYGLIRYFIFPRSIGFENIKEMFNELISNAYKMKLDSFISIGNYEEVILLFEQLGFKKIDFDNFIINDQYLYGTDFESAQILQYKIR